MAYNRTLQHFTSSQELATVWTSGQNYIVNQLVLDNDKLYRCNTAHTSGATFAGDSAYWTGLNQGGIIDIAGGGTGQTTATAAFDALAPTTTAGDLIVYNGTDNIRLPVGSDGQTIIADSSQTNKLKWATIPQGNKNYVTYSNFENNATTGWSLFNTTLDSTTRIPNGTISVGAGSITTFQSTATTPLAGLYSLLVGSSGALTAGQGFITDVLTIDREDQAKVLTFSFFYEVISGTMNFSGTSANTWAVYIHDGTNWIQPAGVYGMTQGSGAGSVVGTFQTNATGTSYRLAVICINNTGGAISMEFDDFKLGPQSAPIGNLRNPVGTIISTGSLTPPTGYLYCNGSLLNRADYPELFTAIGTSYNTGGETGTQFRLPDLRGIFARGAGSQTIGSITYSATLGQKQNDAFGSHSHRTGLNEELGAQWARYGQAEAWTTAGRKAQAAGTGYDTNTSTVGSTETRPANQAVAYHICFSSGTVQLSNDTDTRVVAMRATTSTAKTLSAPYTSPTVAVYETIEYDTHGAYSASTGIYKVPVSGYYRMTIHFVTNSIALPAGASAGCWVRKNGSNYSVFAVARTPTTATGPYEAGGSTIVLCNAGDEIAPALYSDVAGTTQIAAQFNHLSIERLSGPSVVAANETVAASYWSNSAQLIPAGVDSVCVSTPDKRYDTHNIWSAGVGYNSGTGTWTTRPGFTIPVSGKYLVTFSCGISLPGSSTLGTLWSEIVQLRGSSIISNVAGNRLGGSFSDTFASSGSGIINCNAGDFVGLFTFQSTGAARNTSAESRHTRIEIVRVGN